jgi:hypothetical protein
MSKNFKTVEAFEESLKHLHEASMENSRDDLECHSSWSINATDRWEKAVVKNQKCAHAMTNPYDYDKSVCIAEFIKSSGELHASCIELARSASSLAYMQKSVKESDEKFELELKLKLKKFQELLDERMAMSFTSSE